MSTTAYHPSKSFSLKRKASFANIEEQASSNNKSRSSSRLFDLPPVLFHIIFADYLYVEDMTSFDNAICNHTDRTRYLALLNGMLVSLSWHIDTSDELAWIHKRQLRLERVTFGSNIDAEDLCTLYPLHWSSIKQAEFNEEPSADISCMVECLLKCTSLEILKLIFFDDFDDENTEEEFQKEQVDALLSIFDDSDFCAHLRDISFQANDFIVNDETVVAISKYCHNLVRISFGDSYIGSDAMIQFVSSCGANLQEFSFLNCKNYSDSDYKRIIEYCPRLTKIRSNVSSGAFMSEIGRCYPDLLTLILFDVEDDNSQSQSKGLIDLFEGCRKLQNLRIASSVSDDDSLISLSVLIRAFECCRDLRSVSFSLARITARVLGSLALNCSQVEKLTLFGINVSREDWLQFSVICNFPKLRTLTCSYIDICDRFLLEFVRKSTLLQDIDIASCKHVTDPGMSHIATHCRNLRCICLRDLHHVSSPDYLIDILTNNPKIRKPGFSFSLSSYSTSDSLILVNNKPKSKDQVAYTAKLQALLNSRA